LTTVLVEDLGRTRRYASLARRAVQRIAKTIDLPPSSRRHVPDDPKDDAIVQTALTAKADYLVTADAAIIQLGKVQDVEILSVAHFEEKLRPED
jgi:predicted nucleic acid-binding protein